jgi:ankyrin repeat protein
MKRSSCLIVASAFFAVLVGASAELDAQVADAAMRGDIEAVRGLLQGGADVNAAQGDGMSALHWAADHGDVEMVVVLLYAGAQVEGTTRIGEYTPLHIASRGAHVEVVRALLAAGATVSALTNPSGSAAIHLAAAAGDASVIRALVEFGADPDAREAEWQQTPLIFAASWNRVDAIVALLDAGADPNLAAESMDLTEIGRYDDVAESRQSEVLKAFTNDNEWSPTSAQIQAAVRAGRRVYGDPESLEDDDEEEEPPGGFRRQVRITSKGGLTPLLHAARQGHLVAMTTLIGGGAEVDQVGGGDGTSPLLIATLNGQFDAAVLLLGSGADPNIASTINGATPLFATINSEWQPRTRYPQPQQREQQEVGYLEVAEALLDAGADPDARLTLHPWYMEYTGCGNGNCGLIDMNGASAFLRAAYATDVSAMRLLLDRGADPAVATKAPQRRQRQSPDEVQRQRALDRISSPDSFDILSDSSQVALVLSVWSDLPDSVKSDLLEERVTTDPADVREEVAAHALRQDSIKALEPDPSGLLPVPVGGPGVLAIHAASGVGYGEGFAGNAHRHVEDGWLPAVKFLVEEVGMDVNLRDHNGYTAIHHAAARGDNETILYLVEQGGDVTVISRRGQTTADMANGPVSRVSPIPETVALLESLGSANSHNCLTCQQ